MSDTCNSENNSQSTLSSRDSKILKFPKGFLWGSATASYQVEGGIYNNDWSYEGRRGKVPKADIGPDHYNRFEEDFDLVKKLGHNCHRISIEWSRIEPEEGKFDMAEIAHYRKVLKALISRDIKPFVTIWHFTLPLWLYQKGGAENLDFPKHFARYTSFVVENLWQEGIHFDTMNEPCVFTSSGWIKGTWPPFKKSRPFRSFAALHNLIRAHNQAYQKIKKQNPQADIGIVKDNIYFHSDRRFLNPLNFINVLLEKFVRWFWNFYFLDRVKDNLDSIGLNYYFHRYFSLSSWLGGNRHKIACTFRKSDMGWDLCAEGLYQTLLELKKYKKPVYISEAGIADENDTQRADYIEELVMATHRAIESEVPVKAFMYWSLMDNYEWAFGFEKKFGLIAISRDNKERQIRKSAYVYKKICEDNALKIIPRCDI